uniref:Uncharacterized protein n=1 Tax=Pithovirus LCPAC103 TaxID=2506588 RepID=A0A481Z5R9_9VIRU|nr:MAG: hypothetical protein LCPAC103_01110 [Pithovirus LCPAC103]
MNLGILIPTSGQVRLVEIPETGPSLDKITESFCGSCESLDEKWHQLINDGRSKENHLTLLFMESDRYCYALHFDCGFRTKPETLESNQIYSLFREPYLSYGELLIFMTHEDGTVISMPFKPENFDAGATTEIFKRLSKYGLMDQVRKDKLCLEFITKLGFT